MKFNQEKKFVNRRRAVTAMGAFLLGTVVTGAVMHNAEPEAKEIEVETGQVVVLFQHEGEAYAQSVNARELGEYTVKFDIEEDMDTVLNGNVFTVTLEDGELSKVYRTTQEEFDSMTRANKTAMNKKIDKALSVTKAESWGEFE